MDRDVSGGRSQGSARAPGSDRGAAASDARAPLRRAGHCRPCRGGQFIYWKEGDPTQRLAPDVYVLPGVGPDIAIRSWRTWEAGVAPSFVLDVASDSYTKDYEDNPALYAELDVRELVVFDPHAKAASRSRRVRWQVFRRITRRGFIPVEVSQGDRVRSKVLGGFLRAVGSGDAVRVRVGLGPSGDELYPTEAEAERLAKEQARRAEEQARRAEEQERSAKERERSANPVSDANEILAGRQREAPVDMTGVSACDVATRKWVVPSLTLLGRMGLADQPE